MKKNVLLLLIVVPLLLFSQNQLSVRRIDSSLSVQKNILFTEKGNPKVPELINLLNQSREIHYETGETSSLLLIGCLYVLEKNYKEAANYLTEYENLQKEKSNSPPAYYYFAKGKLEAENQDNEKALSDFIRSENLSDKTDAGFLSILYSEMSKIYGERKDYDRQVLYLGKVNKINDSIRDVSRIQLDNNMTLNKEKNEKQSSTLIIVSLIAITGACLFYFFRNRKNAPGVQTNILNSSNGAQMEIGMIAPELIQQAKENDTLFYVNFLKAFPDFSDKLLGINPTLKSSDIEFCALIRLNFETKQIAVIKNMSVRAVEGKKYRIRKKLEISTEENMYIWMSKL